jgi:hypothetical protein
VDAWLRAARDAVAAAAGIDPESLTLPGDDARALLEMARIAAHESGDRTNAPLLCYLVGRAAAEGPSVDALAGAVRQSTS